MALSRRQSAVDFYRVISGDVTGLHKQGVVLLSNALEA
jgi:hypothetical protein